MTRTYKVALGVAGLILAFSVVYYAVQPAPANPDDAAANDIASAIGAPPPPDTAQPAIPRNTLVSLGPSEPDPEPETPAPSPPATPEPAAPPVEEEVVDSPAPAVPTIDLTTLRSTPLMPVDPQPDTQAPDPDAAIVAVDIADPITPTPEPAAEAPPTPTPPATYTVQRGDTLSSIAVQLFGAERRWVDIAQANPTIDPIRLRVGQTLKLPGDAPPASPDEPEIDAPAAELRHTIQSGENLSSIAQRYYGKAARWRVLFNANRDILGNNPNAIRAGMVIAVPPLPTDD
ncbi:MAG: LysM peptidoglycan-binding domain-containing protein [Planctomycetota bacterium]